MNRRFFWTWTAASAAVMLLPPWLAVSFLPGDAGMAVCFLLFYAVDPLYAVCAGWAAGKRPSSGWPLPLLTAVLFLLGAWLCFDLGETVFLLYAFLYLLLGYASMFVRRLLISRRRSSRL